MSRNSSANPDAERRDALARRVKELRLQRGMKQADLASNAKVSRQTLSDIESGKVEAPQLATLRRIYEVLGVDIDPVRFDPQTDIWLTLLGTLIEAVPETRRARAVDSAVHVISAELRPDAEPAVVGGRPEDYELVANDSIDEDRGETDADYDNA